MSPLAFVSLFSALLVSATFLILVLWLAWWLDRFDREPLRLVVGIFCWGAAVAPALSAMALSALRSSLVKVQPIDFASGVVGITAAPLIEEVLKGVAVVLVIVLTNEFDSPTDGVVYGTAVGLGFAVTESFLYGFGAASISHDDTARVLTMTVVRTGMIVGLHAVCSGVFGGFLGHAMLRGQRRRRVAWVVAGMTVTILLHTVLASAQSTFSSMGEGGTLHIWLAAIPGIIVLYLAVLAAFLRSEHPILSSELAEEVELDLAPAWVLEVIPYYCRRVRSDWWPSRTERTVISRLLSRLAFRKYAHRSLPSGKSAVASLEIVRLRQRVREILGPGIELSD